MTNMNHQIEQHILEYESRLEHLDQMLEQADRLADSLGKIPQKDAAELMQEELAQAGPMGIWDAVAQRLEKVVERTGA